MRGILPIAVVLLVLVGGWFLLSSSPATAPTANTTVTTVTETPATPQTATTTPTAPAPVTINYTSQGFVPKTVTVPVGTRVTFVNQTANRMWVGADEHPTHEEYDNTGRAVHCAAGYTGPLPFDQCAAGASYSFTFTKPGTWSYHNHSAASDVGTVIVTAN